MNLKFEKFCYILMGILTVVTLIIMFTTKDEIGMSAVLIVSYILILILMKKNFFQSKSFLLMFIIFPFVAKVLANSLDFYNIFNYYDKFLHILSGVFTSLAAINFIMLSEELSNLSLKFKYGFILLFSTSVAAFWELFEFSCDTFLGTDLQKKGNIDSMTDMYVAIIATILLIIIHLLYTLKIKKEKNAIKCVKMIDKEKVR